MYLFVASLISYTISRDFSSKEASGHLCQFQLESFYLLLLSEESLCRDVNS